MSDAPPSEHELNFRPPREQDKRTLFRQALAGVVATIVVVSQVSDETDIRAYYLGTVICVLSMLPMLIWARTMDHNYPFFELFMATNLTSYGIPLISEHNIISLFDEEVRITAATAVIVFQLVALVAFYSVRTRPRRTDFWTKSVFRDISKRWMINGLVISTIYVVVVQFFYSPEPGIAGILRAIFFGMGTSCIFIVGIAWGLKQLRREEKAAILACVLIQFVVTSVGLVLRTGVSLVLLGLIGYFFGARRMPYISVILTIGICAILNIGKYDLRAQYWSGEYKAQPTLTELPAFYSEWFSSGFTPKVRTEDSAASLLLERNSLLQMLCLVISYTPERKPFLSGETYKDIPGQFVPRIFWPGKPRGHISTYTLSIYYGLQDEEATGATTIAFGLLPEGFANYGFIGMVLLGVVFGGTFKFIVVWSRHSPIFSYAGLLIILLTAWSFQAELTMSIWITSLFQAAVSIVGFVYLFRRVQEVVT